ncbi:MAG: Hydroxyacylglutathione hydrolase, partial [uncultured Solirubrobacteraceae bacterium]
RHEGLLDDRLRARPSAAAARDGRGGLRRADDVDARPAAAELPRHRRAQPRSAGQGDGRGAPDQSAAGRAGPRRRRDGGRRPHGPPVRRGAHPRRRLDHRPARRLRVQAGVAGGSRPGARPRRPRRPGRPRGRDAGLRRRTAQPRRLSRRRHDVVARGRLSRRARAADEPARLPRRLGGREVASTGPRRASGCGVGRRTHPGRRPRALPRHPRPARGHRPAAAGRRDLRLRPARRGGRQPAEALRRRRRHPRRRGRRTAVAARGLADRGSRM